MDRSDTKWPQLETAYTDECGPVDPEVYNAASQIWTYGERLALSTLRDSAAGLRLMMKAVVIVSRRHSESDLVIENLSAYLAEVYKHLVLAELKKINRRRQLEISSDTNCSAFTSEAENMDRKILIEEICRRMDNWTRSVFEWRVIGYTFETIASFLGMRANHVRSEYGKRLARLRREFREEIPTDTQGPQETLIAKQTVI